MAERERTHGWLIMAVAVIVLAGILLRIIHLDADPAWRLWGHHVTDEGRWTEQARRLVAFGTIDVAHWRARLHLLLAPLFQGATWVSFSVFGLGFASARLASAASGIVLLVAGWLFARSRFYAVATLATIAVLALQPELVHISRAAIPEMPALLFSFLSFATVLSRTRSRSKLFLGGVLTLVAAGFKATVAPLAAILAVVAAVTGPDQRPRGLEASASYLAGLAVPVALVPVALLATGHGLGQLFGALSDATYFIRLDDPYGALARFFYSPMVAALEPLFLSCWVAAGLILAGDRGTGGLVRDAYIGSAIWIVGLLVASSAFAYFPDRYILHVIVPLAINLGAALTLLGEAGIHQIRASLAHTTGTVRIALAFWLAAPVAWLLGPALVTIGDLAGFQWDRLRHHLALLAVLLAGITWLVWRLWRAERMLSLAALPLLTLALRWLLIPGAAGGIEFWRPTTIGGLLGGTALVSAAGALAIARMWSDRPPRIAALAFVVVVLWTWVSQELTPLLAPTYTLRDTADAIEQLVGPGEVIGTEDAAGVLLPTRIRYTERFRTPDFTELFLEFKPVRRPFLDDYAVVGHWGVNVAPYQLLWGEGRITLYRRER